MAGRRWPTTWFALVALAQGRGPVCDLRDVTRAMPPGSRALRDYVTHVYGTEPDERAARAQDVHFHAQLECCVDILYMKLLPRELARCAWSRVGSVYGSVYHLQNFYIQPRHSLWVYRYAASGCPHLATNKQVALALPPDAIRLHSQSAEWIEVSHTFTGHYAEKSGLFWMYRAVGSGLWYKPGRTLEVRTHEQLMALAGNVSTWDAVHAWLLQQGYNTFVVTHRCEEWGAAWLSEIVDVPGEPHRPPPPTRKATAHTSAALARRFLNGTCVRKFARGFWPARLEPCLCCAWAVQMPTWCAFGDNFTVQYALGTEPEPPETINMLGTPPIIVRGGAPHAARVVPSAAGAAPAPRVGGGAAAAASTALGGNNAVNASTAVARSARRLQLGLSDLVRTPGTKGGGRKGTDTIHFFHMTCAQAGRE